MTDIVTRLLKEIEDFDDPYDALHREAASTIERLQSEAEEHLRSDDKCIADLVRWFVAKEGKMTGRIGRLEWELREVRKALDNIIESWGAMQRELPKGNCDRCVNDAWKAFDTLLVSSRSLSGKCWP